MHAQAVGIAARDQSEDRPGGLGGCARRSGENAIVVTGAALSPAAICILNGAKPLSGAQHMGFAVVFSASRHAAQCEAGAVYVRNTPTPAPTAVGCLVAH